MNPSTRIENLENFVDMQGYLRGLEYRVNHNEDTDELMVEFKDIREDQLYSFRSSLKAHLMAHVKIKWRKVLPPQKHKPKRPDTRKPDSYDKK